MSFLNQHLDAIVLGLALASCGTRIGQDGAGPLAGYITGIVFGGIATYIIFIH